MTWLRYAEPSTHSYARGSGAPRRCGIDRRAVERRRLELLGERAQRRLGARPSRRARPAACGHASGDGAPASSVAPDDEEPAIAGAIAQRRELHDRARLCLGFRVVNRAIANGSFTVTRADPG